ncbi:MAG: GNAT family N-acetyltransferase [Pseudomonadota bacterium]
MTHLKQNSPGNDASRASTNDRWPSPKKILGSVTGIDGYSWSLELHSIEDFKQMRPRVAELALLSKPANPFFEPAFLAPASTALAAGKIEFLCLVEHSGNMSELKLFAPVKRRKIGIWQRNVLQVWAHPFAPLGTPLIDAGDLENIVSALVNCLDEAPEKRIIALQFQDLPLDTGFARALKADPRLSNRMVAHSAYSRAAIANPKGLFKATVEASGKRKQRLRKATERLAGLGKISYSSTTDITEFDEAMRAHLALEDASWKGKRRSSILANPKHAQFARAAVSNMIADGNCDIHALNLNNYPVASMILFHKSGYYFPWKIAFDETYAKHSVGNLLTSHVNELLLATPDFIALDSLASEANKTARRFWPDKFLMGDLIIPFGKANVEKTAKVAAELDRIDDLKRQVKSWLGRSF